MWSDDERSATLERSSTAGAALRGIRAEVTAGPAAGTSARGAHSLSIGSSPGNDLRIDDRTVSRYHLELTRVDDRLRLTDCDSTNGTRIGGVSVRSATIEITPPITIELGETVITVSDDAPIPREPPIARSSTLRGESTALSRLEYQIDRAAATDVVVHLHGESGTGKELVARAIHDRSARASRPFVVVDCGAVSPSLFASELFGHERGSFTGAERTYAGAFERADGGTVFLDEIGDLPIALQPALLGVLERRAVRRLGGSAAIDVDVRVISATHRDLRSEVNHDRFRPDLYHRLAVATIRIPPLRDRATDIPILISHFMREAGHDPDPKTLFDDAELARLMRHAWPGNVRELRNVVESALVMGTLAPLPAGDRAPTGADPIDSVIPLPYRDARATVLREFERRWLSALLERCEGNVRRAAREGKVDRSHLIDLLKKHDLG